MGSIAYIYKLYLLCILMVILSIISISLFLHKNKYNVKDTLLSFLTFEKVEVLDSSDGCGNGFKRNKDGKCVIGVSSVYTRKTNPNKKKKKQKSNTLDVSWISENTFSVDDYVGEWKKIFKSLKLRFF